MENKQKNERYKKYLTEKEYATIKLLCDKGVDTKSICDIVGRSPSVVNKIRNGTYWELKAKENEKYRIKRQQEQAAKNIVEIKNADTGEKKQIAIDANSANIENILVEMKSIRLLLAELLESLGV